MSKASLRSVIAMAVLAALAGCSQSEKTEPAAAPEAGADLMGGQAHPATMGTEGAEVDLSGIAKPEGGMTVAEVYEHVEHVAGQDVTVRGKVVKTNAGVMGRNWIHVRDGSGTEGTNDLTVTTESTLPNVGETVVVKGAVTANKDFGMGYLYPVIIEDAEVIVEAPAAAK